MSLWVVTGSHAVDALARSRTPRLVHSVSKVLREGRRCCLSNYYFSPRPAGRDAAYHVTSFRGWPDQTLPDIVMRIDNGVRRAVRNIGGNRLFKDPHVYKK